MSTTRLNNLLELLSKTDLVTAFYEGRQVANLSINQEALVLAGAFYRGSQDYLVVKKDLYEAQLLYQNLVTWLTDEEVLLFGAEESLRVEAIANSPELKVQRIDTLAKSVNEHDKIVITHIGALVRHLPPVDSFFGDLLRVKEGDVFIMTELRSRFFDLGYTKVSKVEQPLMFSQRGNIIDIWPADYDYPLRLEFFGDEIDSIRYFDSGDQRTVAVVDEAAILPATDNLFTENDRQKIKVKCEELLEEAREKLEVAEHQELKDSIMTDLDLLSDRATDNHLYRYRTYTVNASLSDYFPKARIVISDYQGVDRHYHNMLLEQVTYIRELFEDRKGLLTFTQGWEWPRLLKDKNTIEIAGFYDRKQTFTNDIVDIHVANNTLQLKIKDIFQSTDRQLFVINPHKLNELIDELIRQRHHYQVINGNEELVGTTLVLPADLNQGFYLLKDDLSVYSNRELFSEIIKTSKYEQKFTQAKALSEYQDLKTKDYVVHYHHGIGQYLGIVTRVQEGVHKDYLEILYRNKAMLYVPLEQFKLVRKYLSNEGISPKLSKLGSGEWTKTKEKIAQNVVDIADRLIKLYGEREKVPGFSFSPDNEIQKQFEDEFIYELTQDQKTAVAEIKADMEKDKPMDRLLCGDVGFGKTEVAIRAAFKAVYDGKQVAYLCPTTILSNQHYQTFSARFANYPVRIALLNRFVRESEQKAILNDWTEGNIDILIGTHRILSYDVKPKDLGLLIIDEEQRFGVLHKEKIKELKTNIDVLSLSATPIPRTLQMSLIGIRALSQLNTPPLNRISVQTYVIEKNQLVIKEVIQRELARKGQVFYLHNNIDTIYSTATQIQNQIKTAKVAVAHGQMDRETIEDVMVKFINRDYDVLVCTTIIETGIDIPNVNTIIIDKADGFGLSQLYQIKGRVGRSNVLGYAYLMYTPNKVLSEAAVKRLQAIKDFALLGSGYKIAMRDLTIRGAGDLLGPNQSGFINSVGIDLYLELLNEAIAERKGQVTEKASVSRHSLKDVDAYIPQQFTDYDVEKIGLYQDIEKCRKLSSLARLIEKTRDLYGKLPKSVSLLFEKKKLEILLTDERIEAFNHRRLGSEIVFTQEYSSKMDGLALFTKMNEISSDIRLKFLKNRVIIFVPENVDWLLASIQILEKTA